METEIHPHKPYTPLNMRFLVMGSFPGRASSLDTNENNAWFYAAKRNQFWKIMEGVFQTTLVTIVEKQTLLEQKGIGVADILLEIHRKSATNLDQDLEIIAYNDKAIRKILTDFPSVTVLFTSIFVEKHFRKFFPTYAHAYRLPSPSPRYAKISLVEKIDLYKKMMLVV